MRDWLGGIGVENMGKRLVNSKEGRVEFDKPAMSLPILMKCERNACGPAPSAALARSRAGWRARAALRRAWPQAGVWPSMLLNRLPHPTHHPTDGHLLVEEQENVKRVQLADEYMSGAALAGASGSSLPEGYSAY